MSEEPKVKIIERIIEKPIIVRHNVEIPRIVIKYRIPFYVWGIIAVEAIALIASLSVR